MSYKPESGPVDERDGTGESGKGVDSTREIALMVAVDHEQGCIRLVVDEALPDGLDTAITPETAFELGVSIAQSAIKLKPALGMAAVSKVMNRIRSAQEAGSGAGNGAGSEAENEAGSGAKSKKKPAVFRD